jgi:hypothetical protein
MAIMVSGGVVGNSFEYEIVTFYEAVSAGSVYVNDISKSDSDVPGFSIFRSFVDMLAQSDIGEVATNAFKEYLRTGALKSLTCIP